MQPNPSLILDWVIKIKKYERNMKEIVHSSSVFMNIESCTLSFKDGKKMNIYSDVNKSLIINVTIDNLIYQDSKSLL